MKRVGCWFSDGSGWCHVDFLTSEPDRQYEFVICLQVLEHIPETARYLRNLFECGRVVIISVPFRRPKGSCGEHVHDPVDERKLQEWMGRDPVESAVEDARLVGVFA